MSERKFKVPDGVKPAFDKGRVVFEMRPPIFGWLWCPIPSLMTKYIVDYELREIVKVEKFGKIETLPIDSVPRVPSSFNQWLSGRGNVFLEKDSVKLELEAVSNPKDFIEFLRHLKDPNFILPSFKELDAQRTVPFWTEWRFSFVDRLRPSFIPYARFMCPYPNYHELSVEQIIRDSEELISFVQSHPEKPVTKLILLWLEPRYFAHLQWLFTQLDIDENEAKYLKKRFDNFQECEKLEERFDALLKSHAEAKEKSLWVTAKEKTSLTFFEKLFREELFWLLLFMFGVLLFVRIILWFAGQQ